jgi:hypothetical protein
MFCDPVEVAGALLHGLRPNDPVTGADHGAAAHHHWLAAVHRRKAIYCQEQAALHADLARLNAHLARLDESPPQQPAPVE